MHPLKTTTLVLAGLLIAAPAFAETTTTTTTVKTTAVVNPAVTTQSGYVAYDANHNGRLEPDEYETYSYRVIDRNQDTFITTDEWEGYTTVWYKPLDRNVYTVKEFTHYDVNGDGHIDFTEYKSSPDINLYRAWDLDNDGFIDDVEYTTTVTRYKEIDANGDYNW
jgi:hypothetical protein